MGFNRTPSPPPVFFYILWKWNNLVSVRPNYFLCMGYLRKMRKNQQSEPHHPHTQTYLYIWTPTPTRKCNYTYEPLSRNPWSAPVLVSLSHSVMGWSLIYMNIPSPFSLFSQSVTMYLMIFIDNRHYLTQLSFSCAVAIIEDWTEINNQISTINIAFQKAWILYLWLPDSGILMKQRGIPTGALEKTPQSWQVTISFTCISRSRK